MQKLSSAPPTISETLAAMDAVDAARNEEELLNDEINIEARKVVLRDKLRATYQANNISVSDEIIEKGVNDFFANRYTFKNTPKSLAKVFAWIYVKRSVIGRAAALWCFIAFACAAVIAAVEYGSKQITVRKEANRIVAAAEAQKRAEQEQRQAIEIKKAIAAELESLPAKINTLNDTVHNLAKEQSVKDEAKALATTGIGAVKTENIDAARKVVRDLNKIIDTLNQEYKIIIQQSPQTIFWRTLDRNPSEKRYYAIVDALDSNGAPVRLSILNEETRKLVYTSKWAEQISEGLYLSLQKEKRSVGVLSNNLFGEKLKGYSAPVFKQGFKANKNVDSNLFRVTSW